MGASQSRRGELESSDSESENGEFSPNSNGFHSPTGSTPGDRRSSPAANGLDARFNSLSLNSTPQVDNDALTVKLYRHVGGNSKEAKWAVCDKLVSCKFVREGDEDEEDEDVTDEEEDDIKKKSFRSWLLRVGSKVRSRVDNHLQIQMFDEQLRVDFVSQGVWAIKFLSQENYRDFVAEFQNCIFENTYLLEATEENKVKVFGKDFLGWADPGAADDSAWEDAEEEQPQCQTPSDKNFREEFEEAATGGIQSLTMGALDHSFLVSESGVEAVKNFHYGIQGKGMVVPFRNGELGSRGASPFSAPKKALLMKAETNMLLMSPAKEGRPHSTGIHQLDIETGRVVTEWKFQKDGTPVTMRDVTSNSKGSQLDAADSTFLGLDDNRLCRWDMRVRHGNVQEIASPVLNWEAGHQFSRGTNFQCFAATGDGCVVVGSADGKIRLYGKTSMRMAKTAFPGLGSPITHVDVTFDGKWILGTTDTYMILISTIFTDKDGKVKTGFSGRMGNKIAAPRLLKLTPVHSHLAGKKNKFHGGQFSWVTESGKQERHLVASVGNFTVIWNFKQVKNSNHECYKSQEGLKSCYCYKVVPKDESIVDSKFMHDKFAVTDNPEAPLVVATPRKVSSFSIATGQ